MSSLEVTAAPMPGWGRCELEVLECREVPWPASEVEASYHIQNQGWEAKDVAYECKVQLFTGRTHQVLSCNHVLFKAY